MSVTFVDFNFFHGFTQSSDFHCRAWWWLTSQIQDLNLDNCRATQIEGLTDEFTNLTTLSLINVGLTTLKGFPNLPALRKVSTCINHIMVIVARIFVHGVCIDGFYRHTSIANTSWDTDELVIGIGVKRSARGDIAQLACFNCSLKF